ncbi:glucosamine-6-phosphate deaminase [Parahaliea mediterranea]|uniref:Glucosamine-6-phosphate deaminase n=1 Tax=Parahaliea mediterranea TaxID=651086 RepID=A0A939DCG9_9GAMM|nr:glucosamine-6-phosphate deaminase [Parahaliea mediterranea]MBN7795057.1 glucosamine-6-phosphate deaminase [Parahaliea mediterranea]
MKVVILDNPAAVAHYGADLFQQQLARKPASVLGLATGSTPVSLYRELIARHRAGLLGFGEVRSFNLDEYLDLPATHPQSYRQFMQREFFDHIDIAPGNTRVPAGDAADPIAACEDYERAIVDAGGIDIQLLGIGRNGHIGFNEPTSCLASRTRVKTLTRETIDDNARFFRAGEPQPHMAITMGIGTIMESRLVVLLATGESKAAAVKAMVEGPVSAWCPASILQMHPATVVLVDEDAASHLSQPDFFKHIERENQALLARLGRG